MPKGAIVCLLMLLNLLNVNTYANVVVEGFFRANEVYFGVNESIFGLMKQPIYTNEWIFSVNEHIFL